MTEITGERLGTALRELAEDLISERRRVGQLERQNRELRQQLASLRSSAAGPEGQAGIPHDKRNPT